jgi:hypothetical protein
LATLKGLRVHRHANVEQVYCNFKQFTIIQLYVWSRDPEMHVVIKDIGMKLLLINKDVDGIMTVMVNEIKEKKALGEKFGVMDSELKLVKKYIHTYKQVSQRCTLSQKKAEMRVKVKIKCKICKKLLVIWG